MSSFLLLLVRAHLSLSLISPASQKCGSYRDVLSSPWHDSPVTCRKGRRPQHSARWTRKPQWRSGHRTHTTGYLNCCGSKRCSARLGCKEKRLLGSTCHTYTASVALLGQTALSTPEDRKHQTFSLLFLLWDNASLLKPRLVMNCQSSPLSFQVLRTQCVPPHWPETTQPWKPCTKPTLLKLLPCNCYSE